MHTDYRANNSFESVVDIYERHARQWDKDRNTSLFEREWLDRFASLIVPQGAVLDLGCGSGTPISQYLIESGFILTGVDASQSMISLCRQRFPQSAWIVADMRALPFKKHFGGILAWNSLFHLCPDDQRRMISAFRELLEPSAPLMFTSGPKAGETTGCIGGEELYHASLDMHDYRERLEQCGFEIVACKAEDAACCDHTIWLARRRSPTSLYSS